MTDGAGHFRVAASSGCRTRSSRVDVALMLVLAVHLYRGGAIVNNAIDIWFDRSDPTVETLNQERRLFGADTWMLATVWMRADRVNDAGDVARALTGELERIDGVSRVISPTSLEVLQRDEQGLFFDELDRDRRGRRSATRCCAIRSPATSSSTRSRRTSFSLLIKEHTGPSTPGAVRQQLVSEVRRVLDTHPAVDGVGRGRHGRHQRRSQPAVLARLHAAGAADGRRRLAGAPGDAAVPVAHDGGRC